MKHSMRKNSKEKKPADENRASGAPFGLSRRKFLFYCGSIAGSVALLGCSGDDGDGSSGIDDVLTDAEKKPPVIWLSGQECTGCSNQFLNHEDSPDIAEIILDTISLRYHEAIMAGSGKVSEQAIEDLVEKGGYVLVVEGSVPGENDLFCEVAGKPFRATVERVAKNADVVIAAGACAAFGGIPRATPSKGKPVSEFVTGTPVINLPHCPAHHEHLLETIVYWLTRKEIPELDTYGRPVAFFSKRIHDQCPRRPQYDAGNFLSDWNAPEQKDFCLVMKGCRGPNTYSDCVVRKYNGGVNHCIDCGAPCAGCAQPEFFEEPDSIFTDANLLTDPKRKEVLT